jgi:hypothetical protein
MTCVIWRDTMCVFFPPLSQELNFKVLFGFFFAGAKVLAPSGRILLLVECVWEYLCLFCLDVACKR